MATQNTTKKKVPSIESWTNNITGEMRVFGNTFTKGKGKEYTLYSTTIGKKNEQGEYDNMFINVHFSKEAGTPDTDGLSIINVKKAFFTVDVWKDKVSPLIVVTEWEEV